MRYIGKNQAGLTHVVVVAIVALVVGVVGFVGWKVWDNKSSKVEKNATNTTADTARKSASSSTPTNTTNDTSLVSSDEQVIAVVEAYCNAMVDPSTKKPLVLRVGTAGESQKRVLYSSDKNFAYVNAVCSSDGATEGSGSAYYLKKVNGMWLFIYRGQMRSEEYDARFNIPTGQDFN